MVAGNTQCCSGLRHRHHRPEGVDDARAAVDEVAYEDRLPACWVCPRTAVVPLVSELLQQLFELIAAAVNVADDVEWPCFAFAVVPERLPLDDGGINLLLGLEDVDVPKAFASEASQRTMQLALLIADDVRTEIPVGARPIAVVAHPLGQVENDGDREHMVLAGERDERLASLWLDVRGIDNRQLRASEPSRGHEMQRRKRVVRRRLIVLVVRDERAESIRRHHFGRFEVFAGKRRLAAPRWSDQDDEGELRDREGHRTNTAICVGGPTWLS